MGNVQCSMQVLEAKCTAYGTADKKSSISTENDRVERQQIYWTVIEYWVIKVFSLFNVKGDNLKIELFNSVLLAKC